VQFGYAKHFSETLGLHVPTIVSDSLLIELVTRFEILYIGVVEGIK